MGSQTVELKGGGGGGMAMRTPATTRTSVLNDRKISQKLQDLTAGLASSQWCQVLLISRDLLMCAQNIRKNIIQNRLITSRGFTRLRIPFVRSSKGNRVCLN